MFGLGVFLSKDLGVGADVNWGRMVPQSTKQVRYSAETLCFPLKERYDFHNLTLDGRELSLRLQEPPLEGAGGERKVVTFTSRKESKVVTFTSRKRARSLVRRQR